MLSQTLFKKCFIFLPGVCFIILMLTISVNAQELSLLKGNSELFNKLKQMEQNATGRVKAKIFLLRGYDHVQRAYASLDLRKMGQEAKGAILALIENLNDTVGLYWKYGDYSTPSNSQTTSPAFEASKTLKVIGKPVIEPLCCVLLQDNANLVNRSIIGILNEVGDARAVKALFTFYSKNYGDLKDYALATLLKVKDRNSTDFFIASLKDTSDYVRWSAAKILGNIGDPRSVEPLIPLLKDNDYEVRRFTADALGSLKDSRAAEPLIPLIKDSKSAVRFSAVRALAMIRDPRVVEQLIPLLKDRESEVRLSAVRILSPLKDKRTVESIIPLLKETELEMQLAAIGALALLDDPRAVEPLIELLNAKNNYNNTGDRYLKEALLNAFCVMSDFRTIDVIINWLTEKDADRKKIQAQQAGSTKEARQIESLIALLKYGNPENDKYIIKTMCKLKEFNIAVPLITVVMNAKEENKTRSCAIEALGEIKDQRAVEPFITLAKDKKLEDALRKSAIEAAGKVNDLRAVEPLIVLLKEDNFEIKYASINALGDLKDSRAIEPLIRVLKDDREYRTLYTAAAGVLKSITNKDFGDDYNKWKTWYNKQKTNKK
jgi:HEAT repeat protein